MKHSLSLALLVAFLGGAAHAQGQAVTATNTAPQAATIAPEDRNAFDDAKQLMHTALLWNTPLEWKETAGSTADVTNHIIKALGTGAPTIEVRGKDNSRSTFALKQAPLGPTLTALADLANQSIWVFPGRLVLAPESALTPEEKTTIKAGVGGEWKTSSLAQGSGWNPNDLAQKIAVPLVCADVKARLAAKGITEPAKAPEPPAPILGEDGKTMRIMSRGQQPLPYEITFGELSPDVQTLLKDLVEMRYVPQRQLPPGYKFTPPTITEASIVSFDDTSRFQTQLRFENPAPDGGANRAHIGQWYVSKPQPAQPTA